MVIDEVLGRFDVGRVDVVVVTGAADDAYRALVDDDMVDLLRVDRPIGALFAVRAIRDRMVRAGQAAPAARVAGRFWNGPIRWARITPASFAAFASFASFAEPGSARVAASLAVLPYSEGRVLLTYETRTAVTDQRAGRRGRGRRGRADDDRSRRVDA